MTVEWMEARAHLGIRVKLIIGFPSNAYWEGWDVRQHFGDGEPIKSTMPIPSLSYFKF